MSEATFNAPLTVVLVHGAFADSSSWDGGIDIFQAAGARSPRWRIPCAASSTTPPTSPAS